MGILSQNCCEAFEDVENVELEGKHIRDRQRRSRVDEWRNASNYYSPVLEVSQRLEQTEMT